MTEIVTLHIFEKEVAMTAYKKDGKLLMLAPVDGKVHKYVEEKHCLELIEDNKKQVYESYVDDNYTDIEKVFKLFKEEGTGWFDKLSSDLVLIVCNVE